MHACKHACRCEPKNGARGTTSSVCTGGGFGGVCTGIQNFQPGKLPASRRIRGTCAPCRDGLLHTSVVMGLLYTNAVMRLLHTNAVMGLLHTYMWSSLPASRFPPLFAPGSSPPACHLPALLPANPSSLLTSFAPHPTSNCPYHTAAASPWRATCTLRMTMAVCARSHTARARRPCQTASLLRGH
eukprot:355893-Chlamydomonas_euryale.AAC.2